MTKRFALNVALIIGTTIHSPISIVAASRPKSIKHRLFALLPQRVQLKICPHAVKTKTPHLIDGLPIETTDESPHAWPVINKDADVATACRAILTAPWSKLNPAAELYPERMLGPIVVPPEELPDTAPDFVKQHYGKVLFWSRVWSTLPFWSALASNAKNDPVLHNAFRSIAPPSSVRETSLQRVLDNGLRVVNETALIAALVGTKDLSQYLNAGLNPETFEPDSVGTGIMYIRDRVIENLAQIPELSRPAQTIEELVSRQQNLLSNWMTQIAPLNVFQRKRKNQLNPVNWVVGVCPAVGLARSIWRELGQTLADSSWRTTYVKRLTTTPSIDVFPFNNINGHEVPDTIFDAALTAALKSIKAAHDWESPSWRDSLKKTLGEIYLEQFRHTHPDYD